MKLSNVFAIYDCINATLWLNGADAEHAGPAAALHNKFWLIRLDTTGRSSGYVRGKIRAKFHEVLI